MLSILLRKRSGYSYILAPKKYLAKLSARYILIIL